MRHAYYRLVNIEEHPEMLPLAFEEVERRLNGANSFWDSAIPDAGASSVEGRLTALTEFLTRQRASLAQSESFPLSNSNRSHPSRYFVQYMPTALVDGCWLQNAARVSTAHTKMGASLTGLYQHQLRGFVAEGGRHFVTDYQAVAAHMGLNRSDVSSYSFAEDKDFDETSLALPTFLLSIAQFPRTFLAEIVGVNLVWQYLDVSALGPTLLRRVCETLQLRTMSDDIFSSAYFEQGREMALAAAVLLMQTAGAARDQAWTGLLRGVAATIQVLAEWFESAGQAIGSPAHNFRQQMIALLRDKAPHARGYHGGRLLGSHKIDDYFDPARFDGEALLEALARSPWVKAGRSDKSALVGRLIAFGGPMTGVFSPTEQQIIRNWIDSLPPDQAKPEVPAAASPPPRLMPQDELHLEGRLWDRRDVKRRGELMYGKCGLRELYHYLVNIEFYPDVLPIAERYARNLLERSMASLSNGERPIPSKRYDPSALEQWVFAKHREQVDSYRPPNQLPAVDRQTFIEANVQLAPLIMIDGGWLQGIASPALIHTTVGRILFDVFVEEIGEGRADRHHANIYRDLLEAMGVDAPPVDSWDFANWDRLHDESFEIPTFWLSISCFPRHFLPEILGMNLAVELAGVGGPYMEARDTLRRFRYPTLFVDVHNAADNVTAGHAALATRAIEMHLDEVAKRDGPRNVDRVWHRVWSGVRATLPQIGHARLFAHRLKRRISAEDSNLVPLIFPS